MFIMWMYAMLVLANKKKREWLCVCMHMGEDTSSYEMWSDGCLLADLFLYSIWRSKLSYMLHSFFLVAYSCDIDIDTGSSRNVFLLTLSLSLPHSFPCYLSFPFFFFFLGLLLLLLLLLMSCWLSMHVSHAVIGNEGLTMFIGNYVNTLNNCVLDKCVLNILAII